MATVTYNAQSLLIDNRPFHMVAASMQYARMPAALWAERIAAARQAGFNTIDTSCPWMLHEPRNGRFHFDDQADLRTFLNLCQDAGMRVLLRIGPYIGQDFDGGGIPSWLLGLPDLRLREANPTFLQHVGRYFARLLEEISDLTATSDGPVILLQVEHGWRSSHPDEADQYLGELVRLIRERNFQIPLTNANDLWQEIPGTIDTWRGYEHLLSHLRQLRTLADDRPRIVSMFEYTAPERWGQPARKAPNPQDVLWHLSEIIAAGAHVVVTPFHGGNNFGFLGGRVGGPHAGTVTTTQAPTAALQEAGQRTPLFGAVKRIATFATQFAGVLGEIDPEFQPVGRDVSGLGPARHHADQWGVSVVHLHGQTGSVVFVFSDGSVRESALILGSGLALPITFGDQAVRWFLLEADLGGAGRLNYANLCPYAVVGRRIAVFFGPAKAPALLSISDTPIEATVPAGQKPLILQHEDLTLVICNEDQIDTTYHNEDTVYVGIDGFDHEGRPIAHPDHSRATAIHPDGTTERFKPQGYAAVSPTDESARRIRLDGWSVAPGEPYAGGTSPRYASLAGPATLTDCGTPYGYGWYRITLRRNATKKLQLLLPEARDRVHLFLDGAPTGLVGIGPGPAHDPLELSLPKGDHTLVALVDNFGRMAEGNDIHLLKGLFGHIHAVKPLTGVKCSAEEATTVDPFDIRGYIEHLPHGQAGHREHLVWTFSHMKKAPLFVDITPFDATGTFLLNDVPLQYYSGLHGEPRVTIRLDPPALDAFKRGRNELRFAPDRQDDLDLAAIRKMITIYESQDVVTEKAAWSFAKWEPPLEQAWEAVTQKRMAEFKGLPCWWRTTFELEHGREPLWFHAAGLSKGQIYVNGRNLGRYFTTTGDGDAVGPQTHFYVPRTWLHDSGPNELLIFDEHGCGPARTKLIDQPPR